MDSEQILNAAFLYLARQTFGESVKLNPSYNVWHPGQTDEWFLKIALGAKLTCSFTSAGIAPALR